MAFKWLNESEVNQEDNRIEIAAPPKTDFDTRAVVSVVTKDISDDANGPNLEGNSV